MKKRKSVGVLLSKRRKIAVLLTVGGLFFSGLGWLILHEFVRVEGTFGPAHHWSEIWFLKLHGLTTFAFIFILGLFWGTHIKAGLKMKKHEKTGKTIMYGGIFLIMTGYLLYYMNGEIMRNWVSTIHWLCGIVFGLFFIGHYAIAKRKPGHKSR